jgi:hypothetical protein
MKFESIGMAKPVSDYVGQELFAQPEFAKIGNRCNVYTGLSFSLWPPLSSSS